MVSRAGKSRVPSRPGVGRTLRHILARIRSATAGTDGADVERPSRPPSKAPSCSPRGQGPLPSERTELDAMTRQAEFEIQEAYEQALELLQSTAIYHRDILPAFGNFSQCHLCGCTDPRGFLSAKIAGRDRFAQWVCGPFELTKVGSLDCDRGSRNEQAHLSVAQVVASTLSDFSQSVAAKIPGNRTRSVYGQHASRQASFALPIQQSAPAIYSTAHARGNSNLQLGATNT